MKSTRDKILNTLLTQRQATIKQLSEVVGINGISVRHHLINLQAEGLVTAEEQRHGVGRPAFVYRLTEKGMERFPTNYLKLTNYLLTELEETLSPEEVEATFKRIGKKQAEESTNIDKNQPIEAQLEQLANQLASDRFLLSWKKEGDSIILQSDNCPYLHVGKEHPEICKIDETLFSEALGREVKLETCMLRGDPRCTYKINL
ncbi:MAG TPA: methanogen output domain 1-containing protein [Anaerolineaceae bacterium]|jgi:predicted ArsR family transcriptional regulator|nr:methanogen output domain 1-containing protein [Anaerolineaceae bacterium]HOR77799.1 methanogen output domain 1-containing protein [Anaerolineaceae bacterium]HPK26520.1 methanogen output domain 1-containing protein [Anaerolineaceae bacterium]